MPTEQPKGMKYKRPTDQPTKQTICSCYCCTFGCCFKNCNSVLWIWLCLHVCVCIWMGSCYAAGKSSVFFVVVVTIRFISFVITIRWVMCVTIYLFFILLCFVVFFCFYRNFLLLSITKYLHSFTCTFWLASLLP